MPKREWTLISILQQIGCTPQRGFVVWVKYIHETDPTE